MVVLVGEFPCFLPLFALTIKGWRYRQKAVVAVVGFALLGLMVTPVRKQVFLLVITVITNVMHCMTTKAVTVQKSGRRPFKKSAFGGEKTVACGAPL